MIAYFDCFSGISGDMFLGALVDAGVSTARLKKELSRLPVRGYKLSAKTVKRAGFAATKVDVEVRSPNSEVRTPKKWSDIEKIIKASSLSKDIKQKGLAIFKNLFKAEAKVHGERFDKIHLHELGAVDCMVDIFGTLIGLSILGVRDVYASRVNLGSGTVKTAHGILPVPAPATLQLLKRAPVYSSGVNYELTTPTGAALISGLAVNYCSIPDMLVSEIGIGAGGKNFQKTPNILRMFVGQSTEYSVPTSLLREAKQWGDVGADVTVIETNIDDMNPQVYDYVIDLLLKYGALDVFLTPIIMKKSRPAVKLSVICNDDKKDELIKTILKETTSIGVRFYKVRRKILQREIKAVKTKYGKIKIKVSRDENDILKASPEYEDCKKSAKKYKVPLLDVMRSALPSDTKKR